MKTRWPAPRSAMPSPSSARQHDRRAQVDLERAVDLVRVEARAGRRSRAARRSRRACRRRRTRPRGAATSARSARSAAMTRVPAPSSAASGSRTSVRRPLSVSCAPALMQAPRDRVPDAACGAGEQGGAAGDDHGRQSRRRRGAQAPPAKTATVAVKPCRKFSPPTGPISPAAKNPAHGRAAELLVDGVGVVVGRRRTCSGRARCR